MAGWGTAVGKIFDWFPGRKEHLRNKRTKIKREMNALTKKKGNVKSVARYQRLGRQLRDIEERLRNG